VKESIVGRKRDISTVGIKRHMMGCVPYVIPYGTGTWGTIEKLMADAGLRKMYWVEPLKSRGKTLGGKTELVMVPFMRLKVVVETSICWPGFARMYIDKKFTGTLRRRLIIALLKKDKTLRGMVRAGDDGQKIRFMGEMWAEWKMLRERSFEEYVRYVHSHKWSDGRWRAAYSANMRL